MIFNRIKYQLFHQISCVNGIVLSLKKIHLTEPNKIYD